MSPDAYDELSAEDRAIFADAVKLGANASRAYAAEAEKSGAAALQKAGMQVLEHVDREKFVAAMAAAMPKFENSFGRDAIERFRAVS